MIIKTSFLLLPPLRRDSAVPTPRPVVLLTRPMAPPAAASAGVGCPPTETTSRSAVSNHTANQKDNATENKEEEEETKYEDEDVGQMQQQQQEPRRVQPEQESGVEPPAAPMMSPASLAQEAEVSLTVHSFVTPMFQGTFANGEATGFMSEYEDIDTPAPAAPAPKRQRMANVSFGSYHDLCSFLDGGKNLPQPPRPTPATTTTTVTASGGLGKRKRSEPELSDAKDFNACISTMRDLSPRCSTPSSPLSSSDSSDHSDSEDSCLEDGESDAEDLKRSSADPAVAAEEHPSMDKLGLVALDEHNLDHYSAEDDDDVHWDTFYDIMMNEEIPALM